MGTLQTIRTATELESVLDRLADDVRLMREAGGVDLQDAQRIMNALVQVRLVLNELERTEVQQRGVSRESAERFNGLENRIRAIGAGLQQAVPANGASAHRRGGNEGKKSMYTVLVVDDDEGVRGSVGDMLSRSGYGVLKAADGTSALELLKTHTVDLLLTDYRMPGMDGLQLTRQVREAISGLPVVIMTGYGDLESYLCAASLDVVRYVGKPVGIRELLRTVRDSVADGICEKTLQQTRSKNVF